MPLPPALAARLAKRGILKDASVAGYDPQLGKAVDGGPKGRPGNLQSSGQPSYGYEGRNLQEPEEEVFAENYDEHVVNQGYERVKSAMSGGPICDPTKWIGHSGDYDFECKIFNCCNANVCEALNDECFNCQLVDNKVDKDVPSVSIALTFCVDE